MNEELIIEPAVAPEAVLGVFPRRSEDTTGDPGDEVEAVTGPIGMEPELERVEELEGDDDRVEAENGIA